MEEPLKVLHVVSGMDGQGGIMSFVARIASENVPGVENFIWKHRDFKAGETKLCYISEGKARHTDRNLRADILGACLEVVPLIRWARRQGQPILHAHSRVGIFAGCTASLLTGVPLLIHLHALAGHPWVYRFLWRLTRARPVFNSSKTCRHFGCDPSRSLILMPPTIWPKAPSKNTPGPVRFVACGAFVRGKHFDFLVRAFQQLRQQGTEAELHIYGLSSRPTNPECQMEIIGLAQNNHAIHLQEWEANWLDRLAPSDIFVHLGLPESFGMVILEAFGRGCKLVVLRDTFLEELPTPLNTSGVYEADELTVGSVAHQMKRATMTGSEPDNLWELRSAAVSLFSLEESRAKLARIYQTVY